MRTLIIAAITGLLSLSVAAEPFFESAGRAIRGYDPVAYFTDNRARQGSKQYTYKWGGTRWWFASAEHKALFEENPERYAPQYGGYCAYAAAQGYAASIDPKAWNLHNGKLYLNYSTGVQRQWQADKENYIEQADRQWPKLKADL